MGGHWHTSVPHQHWTVMYVQLQPTSQGHPFDCDVLPVVWYSNCSCVLTKCRSRSKFHTNGRQSRSSSDAILHCMCIMCPFLGTLNCVVMYLCVVSVPCFAFRVVQCCNFALHNHSTWSRFFEPSEDSNFTVASVIHRCRGKYGYNNNNMMMITITIRVFKKKKQPCWHVKQ